MSDIKLIFAYMVFLGFVIQVTALGAPSFIGGNAPYIPEAPKCEIGPPEDVPQEGDFWANVWRGVFDVPVVAQAAMFGQLIGCAWSNMTFFFDLMKYSSTVAILGAIIFIPFGIIILWIIMKYLMPG